MYCDRVTLDTPCTSTRSDRTPVPAYAPASTTPVCCILSCTIVGRKLVARLCGPPLATSLAKPLQNACSRSGPCCAMLMAKVVVDSATESGRARLRGEDRRRRTCSAGKGSGSEGGGVREGGRRDLFEGVASSAFPTVHGLSRRFPAWRGNQPGEKANQDPDGLRRGLRRRKFNWREVRSAASVCAETPAGRMPGSFQSDCLRTAAGVSSRQRALSREPLHIRA
jgi:hypothetical protein